MPSDKNQISSFWHRSHYWIHIVVPFVSSTDCKKLWFHTMPAARRQRTQINGQKISELEHDRIADLLDYVDPDLASTDDTQDLDFNTLLMMLCFMVGWHPTRPIKAHLGQNYKLYYILFGFCLKHSAWTMIHQCGFKSSMLLVSISVNS